MYGTVLMPLHAYITATTAAVAAVKHTNTRKLYKTIAARIFLVLLFILVMNFDYK